MGFIRKIVLLSAALWVSAAGNAALAQVESGDMQRVSGTVILHLHNDAGLAIAVKGDEDGDPADDYAIMAIAANSGVSPKGADGVRAAGRVQLIGAMVVASSGLETYLTDPALQVVDGHWVVVHGANGEAAFDIRNTRLSGDDALIGGALVVSQELAARMGQDDLYGHIVGQVISDAVVSDDTQSNSEILGDSGPFHNENAEPEAAGDNGNSQIDIGVSRLGLNSSGSGEDWAHYGASGGIRGYSIATTSCNYGSAVAEWQQFPSLKHPVIGQNFYRLQDGRFEHVGQSWLKHSFCAVSEPTCGSCSGTSCSTLGIGCADTYWATLNDGASGGPKSWISPQGVGTNHPNHSWPPASGPTAIRGRLQVKESDIVVGLPNVNGGTMYFAEAHYITHDEHRSNRNNNASWRQIYFPSMNDVLGTGSGQGSVHAQEQAIEAWKDEDSGVTIAHTYEVSGGSPWGRYTVGHRAYDNGDGTYDYEYAVHNMNGERNVGTFSVPVPNGVNITNVGFHDVDYHSGEPYSGTNWDHDIAAGAITWSTETFSENPNANAIRWGTLYNFRFTADSEPTFANVTLGMHTPGSPESISAFVGGPSAAAACAIADCADTDDNGIRDDTCVWWECTGGTCSGTDIVFADFGSDNGSCPPDGAVDGNDRFHALNCFADQDTTGVPGQSYPCEDNPPAAMRADAAGFRAPCTPDGVCDANDAFAALNAFEGQSACSCAGAAPLFVPDVVERVAMRLSADRAVVRSGDLVRVTIELADAVSDLRGYQLHAEARGGLRGELQLIDMVIEQRKDWAFAGEGDFRAFNLDTAQLLSGLESSGLATPAGAYLATLTYRVSDDAAGRFVVDLRLADSAGRSGLFTTSVDQAVAISATTPAIIQVGSAGSRSRLGSR